MLEYITFNSPFHGVTMRMEVFWIVLYTKKKQFFSNICILLLKKKEVRAFKLLLTTILSNYS